MNERRLPPSVDATPEENAQATFRSEPHPVQGTEYRCVERKQVVEWTVVLGDDGVCEDCVPATKANK